VLLVLLLVLASSATHVDVALSIWCSCECGAQSLLADKDIVVLVGVLLGGWTEEACTRPVMLTASTASLRGGCRTVTALVHATTFHP
jgi:hypothetical protein